tara:strand:+ start:686 stop:1258 length:573 start_codon:yes stop_codon:yes gene_type:complete
MAIPWQPSRNARLTLRQLGLSAHHIEAIADTYARQSGEKSDLAFMRYAREHAHSPELERGTATVLEIPPNWQPPPAIENRLLAAGYQGDAIAHYRELFVISARERGRVLRDPGKAFFAFCQNRPADLEAPLPSDWLPRATTLNALVQNGQLERSEIPECIHRFVSSHSEKLSANWNHCFEDWVQRRSVPA